MCLRTQGHQSRSLQRSPWTRRSESGYTPGLRAGRHPGTVQGVYRYSRCDGWPHGNPALDNIRRDRNQQEELPPCEAQLKGSPSSAYCCYLVRVRTTQRPPNFASTAKSRWQQSGCSRKLTMPCRECMTCLGRSRACARPNTTQKAGSKHVGVATVSAEYRLSRQVMFVQRLRIVRSRTAEGGRQSGQPPRRGFFFYHPYGLV